MSKHMFSSNESAWEVGALRLPSPRPTLAVGLTIFISHISGDLKTQFANSETQ